MGPHTHLIILVRKLDVLVSGRRRKNIIFSVLPVRLNVSRIPSTFAVLLAFGLKWMFQALVALVILQFIYQPVLCQSAVSVTAAWKTSFTLFALLNVAACKLQSPIQRCFFPCIVVNIIAIFPKIL